MGRASVPWRAALLLGVLLAVGGTEVPEIAAAQGSLDASATNACTANSATFDLNVQLNVPVKFTCPAGSTFKPQGAVGENLVALDGEACSTNVRLPDLGLIATLSNPSGSETRLGAQPTDKQYVFTVTKLPAVKRDLCYVCEMPSSPGALNNGRSGDPPSGSSSPTKCQVKIHIPADQSPASTAAPSTPAPSSSSTQAGSASLPYSSIGTFTGVLAVFLCLVNIYVL